ARLAGARGAGVGGGGGVLERASREGRLRPREEAPPPTSGIETPEAPAALDEAYAETLSTQEAFSRVLSALSRLPIADFLVTASPDVATSTHLGGWINRRGVYSHPAMIDYFAPGKIVRPLNWRESPKGPHRAPGVSANKPV